MKENVKVYRAITEQIRLNLDYEKRQNDYDRGLISAWEAGREFGITNQALSTRVKNGALLVFPFKGGHSKKLKSIKFKYGTFSYLAYLQGVMSEDLDIDFNRDEGLVLACTETKMETIFTSDINKFKD